MVRHMKKMLVSTGAALLLVGGGAAAVVPAANASGPCTLSSMVTAHWEPSKSSPSTTLWPGEVIDVSMFTERNDEGTWTRISDGPFTRYVLDFWEAFSCK